MCACTSLRQLTSADRACPHASHRPWLLLAVIALIVYGSLYPFNFKPDAIDGGCSRRSRQLSWARAGRGDRISNVLLYLPLGFCLFLWLEHAASRRRRAAARDAAGHAAVARDRSRAGLRLGPRAEPHRSGA